MLASLAHKIVQRGKWPMTFVFSSFLKFWVYCCTGEWWWWADSDWLSSDGINKSCQCSGAVWQRCWMCSQVHLFLSFGNRKCSLLCMPTTFMHEMWWVVFAKPLCNCMQTLSPLLARTAILWCDLLHFMANSCRIICLHGSIMRSRAWPEALYNIHSFWFCSMTQSCSWQMDRLTFKHQKGNTSNPKSQIRNTKQRRLRFSGSSRRSWATFRSMMRVCLMCGQTFRYVAFLCFVAKASWATYPAKVHKCSLCLVSHACYFSACIRGLHLNISAIAYESASIALTTSVQPFECESVCANCSRITCAITRIAIGGNVRLASSIAAMLYACSLLSADLLSTLGWLAVYPWLTCCSLLADLLPTLACSCVLFALGWLSTCSWLLFAPVAVYSCLLSVDGWCSVCCLLLFAFVAVCCLPLTDALLHCAIGHLGRQRWQRGLRCWAGCLWFWSATPAGQFQALPWTAATPSVILTCSLWLTAVTSQIFSCCLCRTAVTSQMFSCSPFLTAAAPHASLAVFLRLLWHVESSGLLPEKTSDMLTVMILLMCSSLVPIIC